MKANRIAMIRRAMRAADHHQPALQPNATAPAGDKDIEQQLFAYIESHLDRHGICRFHLEGLVWGIAAQNPTATRPKIGDIHIAMKALRRQGRIVFQCWMGRFEIRLPSPDVSAELSDMAGTEETEVRRKS
jgi:hypothetical protein